MDRQQMNSVHHTTASPARNEQTQTSHEELLDIAKIPQLARSYGAIGSLRSAIDPVHQVLALEYAQPGRDTPRVELATVIRSSRIFRG